jgi:hypothetical protein
MLAFSAVGLQAMISCCRALTETLGKRWIAIEGQALIFMPCYRELVPIPRFPNLFINEKYAILGLTAIPQSQIAI